MNRFDRILWRINGVLLLATIIIILFVFGLSFRQMHRPPSDEASSLWVHKSGTQERESLRLADVRSHKGSPYLTLRLETDTPAEISSFKSDHRVTRNYLFLNTGDLTQQWLFDGFNQTVLHLDEMHDDSQQKNAIGFLCQVITRDTNHDGSLTAKDRSSLFFVGPDGRRIRGDFWH